ncbi:D-threo-aldose 1-dehydrogenase [Paraburkholderia youngii]
MNRRSDSANRTYINDEKQSVKNMRPLIPPGPLGFGAAPLGNLFAPVSDEAAEETLSAAWDAGMRYFDTAPFYGMGLSEQRLGRALAHHAREEFVVSTKVGRLLVPDASVPRVQHGYVGALPFRVEFDYSAEGVHRSIDASLRRLSLDRIDIVYIHDVAEDTHGEDWQRQYRIAADGAMRALTDLRDQGVIGAWGLGVNRVEPCLMTLRDADPDVFLIAGRYTLLDTSALDTLIPVCDARGVQLVAGGPFNSGLLVGGTTFEYAEAPAEMLEKRRRLLTHCERFGVDLKAAALQFTNAPRAVACVIAGARNATEIRQNCAAMTETIPPAFWAALKTDGLLPADAPEPLLARGAPHAATPAPSDHECRGTRP